MVKAFGEIPDIPVGRCFDFRENFVLVLFETD